MFINVNDASEHVQISKLASQAQKRLDTKSCVIHHVAWNGNKLPLGVAPEAGHAAREKAQNMHTSPVWKQFCKKNQYSFQENAGINKM